jgi:lipoyl(octanoyl) transferase
MRSRTTVHRLGRVEYVDGLELQRQFQDARRAGVVMDTLLLLEHPAVLTLGRGARASNIIAAPGELERRGVSVHETDRGGDVTYHGPGQLVGYPLLHLPPEKQDVRRYVRSIEEVIIRTLADLAITAVRIERWPGVWVESSRAGGPRKICALGVHLSRWYTRHGFALNIATDLSHFGLIVPCGIKEAGVTSMEAELACEVTRREVEPVLLARFAEVFETDAVAAPEPERTVSVWVVAGSGSGSRVLLLERTPERGGFWQCVTGRAQPGESVEACARRELREETGLEVPVLALGYEHDFALGLPAGAPSEEGPHGAKAPHLVRETAFVARLAAPGALRLDASEHVRGQWVSAAEAFGSLPFEGLREALRLALRA